MSVAPLDGTVVDIVASLHLADGNVVSCFVLVVSLGFAQQKRNYFLYFSNNFFFCTGTMSNFMQTNTSFKVYNFAY